MIDSLVTFVITVSGGHAALGIVLFTLAVRLLLLPLNVRQARTTRIKERLAPSLRALQKRHQRNPERLAKEVSALYAKEGTSPFAGIMPMLAQLPFLWLMYRVATHPTALAGHDLFGAPLGQQVAGVIAHYGLASTPVLVFILVIVLVAAVAWLSARQIKITEEQPELMRKIMPLLPYGSVLAALVLPLAAGIYMLVSTAWAVSERAVLASRPL
ncbi:membrane protein insertase YidC [Nonomuraea sp. KC401]|uniref:YidC/Oxa1 family membrane protein insertase n=1 Tax=unclassified Nonomuraea TaxID=2593643 RepID=UPI0010FEBBD9|nr:MULTISPECIES: membrane protein insertase YidC [unclassified Nonomuraea]NBE91932.1 membrane protein insertase YidC [Nonomuraea sp. K271]TLF71804.1 membrane protein insertase YidC [Nonomuraea sp. KC401]